MSEHFKISQFDSVNCDYNFAVLEIKCEKHWRRDLSSLELLKLSIEKWQAIVDYLKENPKVTIADGGVSTCALCSRYFHNTDQCAIPCKDCPIRNDTGSSGCYGTPYDQYSKYKTLTNAEIEVQFLTKLFNRLEKGVPG